LVFRALAHRSIVVVVVIHSIVIIIDDGRGHKAVGAGVRQGVGCRLNKFFAENIPVSEKGGEVLLLSSSSRKSVAALALGS